MSRRLNGFNAPQWLLWTLLVLLGLAALLGREWLAFDADGSPSTVIVADGDASVRDLFESRTSGEMVTIEGMIERLLDDDNRGSRHQRFIVRLRTGTTLLIAHNIDLAERVPFERGDAVQIRGEYEWNERGGLLHWTHHDPAGNRLGGWIEFEGTRYR